MKSKPLNLDQEEQELLSSFEKGEWKSVKPLKEEKKWAQETASRSLCKNARINIRLSETDLLNIKMKAAYEGIPYQTLIAGILHKYAAGHLKFS